MLHLHHGANIDEQELPLHANSAKGGEPENDCVGP